MSSAPKFSIAQVFGLLWLFIVWLVCLYFVIKAQPITREGIGDFLFLLGIFTAPVLIC
jgi:succinate-acetate transporter protein